MSDETDAEKDVRERFAADTAGHQMTVLKDDGLYRHVRFRNCGHSLYWFDLVTWPGCLAVNGDMDGYTFARVPDMFEFFRHPGINPQYWAEKITAGGRVREYSETRFRQHVWEYFDDCVKWGGLPRGHGGTGPGLSDVIREEITADADVAFEDGARQLAGDFAYRSPLDTAGALAAGERAPEPWRFADSWEWDLRDWSYRFLWACHAVRWGVEQYDRARGRATARHAGTVKPAVKAVALP